MGRVRDIPVVTAKRTFTGALSLQVKKRTKILWGTLEEKRQ
jgi:hypothetical protein